MARTVRAVAAMLVIPLAVCSQDAQTPEAPPETAPVERGVVTWVADGDTVTIRVDDGEKEVRLIGIDAPEVGEYLHREATDRLTGLVADETVTLVADLSDRDRHGRLLRYLYVGDRLVNEVLVREGYAVARRYPPDTSLAPVLERAERQAREARSGLWGAPVRHIPLSRPTLGWSPAKPRAPARRTRPVGDRSHAMKPARDRASSSS